MPIATPQQYVEMLEAAQAGDYAYPAINITSLVTLNAALKGFADKKSDGIIQVSTGGGKFASGLNVGNAVLGSIVLAEAAHRLAERYNILIALHTDHCPPGRENPHVRPRYEEAGQALGIDLFEDVERNQDDWKKILDTEKKREQYGWVQHVPSGDQVASFLHPLIDATAARRASGQGNLFQSHMLDASALPLDVNMAISQELLVRCQKEEIILEVEAGVVGGEEDGAAGSTMGNVPDDKLYTTPEDMESVHEALHAHGRFLFAATFGNVHGHYKPGSVKLRPDILKKGQQRVVEKFGEKAKFDLVFHGGSGTPRHELEETLKYGVVKMNIDTDTQYAFTRPVADHLFKNYDGVLKVDGEVGNKKVYDPRSYLKKAEQGVADRLGRACDDLHSTDKSLLGG